MNAPFAAVRTFGRAAHSPDDFEPTDDQIAARAAYLKPLLLADAGLAGELLATQNGTPAWDAFATMLLTDQCEAGRMARAMLETAAGEEAERIADNELTRWVGAYSSQYNDMQTLVRIRAGDVWSWLAKWER